MKNKKSTFTLDNKIKIFVAVITVVGSLGAGFITEMIWSPSINIEKDINEKSNPSLYDKNKGSHNSIIKNIETGTKDRVIITSQQSKDNPVILRLMENRVLLGSIKFNIYTNDSTFKVDYVKDNKNQKINTYHNSSRPIDKNIIKNWDSLLILIGKNKYSLRIGYDSGKVQISHFNKIN